MKKVEIEVVEDVLFQGDVGILRVPGLPDGARETPRNGPIVIAHSETGHHHLISEERVRRFEVGEGPDVQCYLQVDTAFADAVHLRDYATHGTARLLGGESNTYQIIRQRETTPEGWSRLVQD